MGNGATLRASDADREAVADRLRVAAGEGRLDHDELEARLESALTARTYGELDWLLADLPGPAPGPLVRGHRRSPARTVAPMLGLLMATTLVVAVVLVVAAVVVAWWTVLTLVCLVRWLHRRNVAQRGLRPPARSAQVY